MSITTVIANIQSKWLSISGIKDAPPFALEGEGVFPFTMTYERSGEMQLQSAGWSTVFPSVWSEIHVGRALLPKAIELASSYRDPFLEKLRDDPTLGGTCQTIVRVTWEFGNLQWATEQNLGYRFQIFYKDHLT